MVVAASPEAALPAKADDQPLRAIVTPHVAQAPAVVRIQAIVRPAKENGGLVFVLDSGDYYRSSVITLDGDTAARVHQAEFRSVPAGAHQVVVALVDRRGGARVTVYDAVHIMD